ncbi:ATP-dependent nuclease [Pseudocolwellia agarivorans]|uniref:ATP-dependent nuclease n=1 Tax=Pseudocolwellia agarivorans TaxID=1911682 RepID=UPI003F880B10
MHICKMEVQNYRSLRDFTIELKPTTLIIGENNIGKTNLLNAISLILNNEIISYQKRGLSINDFNYDALQEFKSSVADLTVISSDIDFPTITIEATFTDFNNDDEEALVYEWYVDDTHKTATLKYEFYCNLTNRIKSIDDIRRALPKVPEELIGEEKEKAEQLRIDSVDLPILDYKYRITAGLGGIKPDSFQLAPIKIDFLDALRDAKTELSASRENRLLYRILSNRDESEYTDIKSSADELNKAIGADKNALFTIKNDITELLDVLSLETDPSKKDINFSFSSLNLSELLKKISLEYGDKPISIENNGLGRNNLLYMALVLSHIQSKAKAPDFRLIAIEEPEAHISPILQKHFAESVTGNGFFNDSSNRQIILTSHSTHISSYLDVNNTVVIFNNEGKLDSHYLLSGIKDDAKGKRTKNYLRKWLNATNSIMFLSRRIIFVEGIAEQILIPKLFEIHFGSKPEKMNCQIVNVNGVAFRNFLTVVNNGYFIKSVVITDSDSATKTKDRAINLKKDFDSKHIQVCISDQTTFEKELIAANSTGTGRSLLNKAIKNTRPNKSKEPDVVKLFTKKLIPDEVFELIGEHKAEFAFDLLHELEKNSTFIIPPYIINAFKFIGEID